MDFVPGEIMDGEDEKFYSDEEAATVFVAAFSY